MAIEGAFNLDLIFNKVFFSIQEPDTDEVYVNNLSSPHLDDRLQAVT